MALFDPAQPIKLILETIENIREETGEKLIIEKVALGLVLPVKRSQLLSMVVNLSTK